MTNLMRKFDLFQKPADDNLKIQTWMGGLITIGTFCLISILIYHSYYANLPSLKQQAYFQPSSSASTIILPIHLDLIIAYPCFLLNFDLKDSTGNRQKVVTLSRQPLDQHFSPLSDPVFDTDPSSIFSQCGDCYGTNVTCCLTCFDVANAFRRQGKMVPNLQRIAQCQRDKAAVESKQTCKIVGTIKTEFLHGELLITPGGPIKAPVHFKNDLTYFGDSVNLSHWITQMKFGASGFKDPLENHKKIQKRGFFYSRYTLNLVPTLIDGALANQYSAFYSEKEILHPVSKRMPGIAFVFEIAPISVKMVSTGGQFIMSICAIIGGCFALAGLADSFWFKLTPKKYN